MIVTPGLAKFAPLGRLTSKLGLFEANTDFISNIDRVNYRSLRSDENGQFTLPALIPGATYAVAVTRGGQPAVVPNFQVEANATRDLGDTVVDRPAAF